jgi:hypothetical protein
MIDFKDSIYGQVRISPIQWWERGIGIDIFEFQADLTLYDG